MTPDVADSQGTAIALLRIRTFLYGSVATMMLLASIGEVLERLVSLVAFSIAIVAPLVFSRGTPSRGSRSPLLPISPERLRSGGRCRAHRSLGFWSCFGP